MANSRAKKIIDALMEEYDLSKRELIQALSSEESEEETISRPDINSPSGDKNRVQRTQKVQRNPRPSPPTKDPLAKQRGISDVGVQEKQPSVTTGSVVGSGSVIGNRPVLGFGGMKEISDRIFGRR